MTEYEHSELLRKLLNKTRGNEAWFDYSPADVMFWEDIRRLIDDKTASNN